VKVLIPSTSHSYTAGSSTAEATGQTVDQVLTDLDRQYKGLRFRIINEQNQIRPHIKIFLNRIQISELTAAVRPEDEVAIVQAFSGG
jgi:molybdopterin converting factor small subunit